MTPAKETLNDIYQSFSTSPTSAGANVTRLQWVLRFFPSRPACPAVDRRGSRKEVHITSCWARNGAPSFAVMAVACLVPSWIRPGTGQRPSSLIRGSNCDPASYPPTKLRGSFTLGFGDLRRSDGHIRDHPIHRAGYESNNGIAGKPLQEKNTFLISHRC